MIKASVTATSLALTPDEKLTAGRVGLTCEFTFSGEWEGLAKTVTFESDRAVTAVMAGDIVTVPPEVMAAAGYQLKIAVTGKTADGRVVIPTIWAKAGKIENSAATGEYEESRWQPAPDLAAQVIQLAANAEEMARSVKQAADRGDFKGERGEKGESGNDGHTPAEAEIRAVFAPELREIGESISAKIGGIKISGTELEKTDGTVELPVAGFDGYGTGLFRPYEGYGITSYDRHGLAQLTESEISSRDGSFGNGALKAVTVRSLDYAVKAAMTDGRGAAWTADEKKASWARLGLIEDLGSRAVISPARTGEFSFIATNKQTFVRIGSVYMLSVAVSAVTDNSSDIDHLIAVPPEFAPTGNSVGLAFNSSQRVSGFCYIRAGSGQIVVRTGAPIKAGNEIDISIYWAK